MDVYAVLIGTAQRKRHMVFHFSQDASEITLAFPYWVLVEKGHPPVLVDTGFAPGPAKQHGIVGYRDPTDSLAELGIDPAEIKLALVSHLHYDHFGVPERFPNAEFVVQREDVDYYTRRGVGHAACRLADPESLSALDGLRAAGRLRELDGDSRISAGVRAVLVGGHSPGMQITVVDTGARRVVLACDAVHFYSSMETKTPTTVIHNYENYMNGFDTIAREAAAGPRGMWIPGHDPAMLDTMTQVGRGIYRVEP